MKVSLQLALISFLMAMPQLAVAQNKSKGIGSNPDFVQPSNSTYSRDRVFYFLGLPSPHNEDISQDSFNSVKESKEIARSLQRVFRFDCICLGADTSEEFRKSQISMALSSISEKVSSNDGSWVILFLSGHGVAENGKYYFIAEDSKKENLPRTAISGETLQMTLKDLANAGHKVVLFLDTCNSGSLIDNTLAGISNPKGGIAIFASSKPDEYSYESSLYGGSRYAQQIAYAFNGENSEAALDNGDVTFSSLQSFLLKKASGQQTPQLALYGSLRPETPLVRRLPEIVDYLDIVDRYNESIAEIQSALNKKDFLNALTIARAANQMGVDPIDILSDYTSAAITRQYVSYISSLPYDEIDKIGSSLSAHSEIIDNSILNKNVIERMKGESLKKTNQYSKALSHNLTQYSQMPHKESILDDIINIYSEHNPTDISTDELKQLMALYPDLKKRPTFKHAPFAKYLYNYCESSSHSAQKIILSPECDNLVMNMWEDSAHSEEMKVYAAQAFLNKEDKENALNLVKDVALKNPKKDVNKIDLSDIDVFYSSREYSILVDVLPTEVSQRIKKQRRGSPFFDSIKDGFEEFADNLASTESKLGLAIQSNVSTLPLGVYAEFDYKFAHFAVDASFGGSLAQAFTTKQTVSLNIGNTTTTQSEKLLESNEKPSWFIGGSLGLNLMNYVTLDFGLGALKSIVVSKYEITNKNTSTTGVTAGTTTATSGISIENKTTEFRESSGDKYLYLKPGIRGYIPLDSNGLRLSLGVSYLICPKNKSMNTWIGSIGIAFILE